MMKLELLRNLGVGLTSLFVSLYLVVPTGSAMIENLHSEHKVIDCKEDELGPSLGITEGLDKVIA